MNDIRHEVIALFDEVFDGAPEGVWSAPGLVNLIGEHTEYNKGFVLPFAIERRTFSAVRIRTDRTLRVASAFAGELVELNLNDLSTTTLEGWSAVPFGVMRALGHLGADLAAVPGVEIFVDSDLPAGTGLGSSASLECSLALALNDTWGLGFDNDTLALAGQLAENIADGAPAGIMDPIASLYGQPGQAMLLDCRSRQITPVDLNFERDGLSLFVIDTATSHDNATAHSAERRAACERGASVLGIESLRDLTVDDLNRARHALDDTTFRRVRHVVTENRRVLETARVLTELGGAAIGEILDASHRSLRDDFEVSTPELDLAVETALAHGALGARMTGGGLGGCAIALIPRENASLLRVAIDGAFAEHGYGQPDSFGVSASLGAQRDA
ncbi:MAG: galactokinase [Terrimesophilobacter sp.]